MRSQAGKPILGSNPPTTIYNSNHNPREVRRMFPEKMLKTQVVPAKYLNKPLPFVANTIQS